MSDLNNPMLFEKAKEIFTELKIAVNTSGDEDLKDLYKDFVLSCAEYAKMRAEWNVMDKETRISEDSYRTSLHNSVIRNLTILKRNMANSKVNVDWYYKIIESTDDNIIDINKQPYRKIVGDFACHLVDILGISAR